jgi:hypothetical protein
MRDHEKTAVLFDVAGHELDLKQGFVMVFCGDCDRATDKLRFKERLFEKEGKKPRIHRLALNGGALLIPSESPLGGAQIRSQVFFEDVEEACALKGLRAVALYAHLPCGKAASRGLCLWETMELLMRAKMGIKAHFLAKGITITVACFVHIDKGSDPEGNDRFNTYFASRNAWMKHRVELMNVGIRPTRFLPEEVVSTPTVSTLMVPSEVSRVSASVIETCGHNGHSLPYGC